MIFSLVEMNTFPLLKPLKYLGGRYMPLPL